jgi:hypothetical protein
MWRMGERQSSPMVCNPVKNPNWIVQILKSYLVHLENYSVYFLKKKSNEEDLALKYTKLHIMIQDKNWYRLH